MTGSHRMINPISLAPARGYSHAVVASAGQLVSIAGQIGVDPGGRVSGPTFLEQFDQALHNVVVALEEAGAEPSDVVSMLIFTTTIDEYRAHTEELGPVYRRHMGRHYPAMALLGVTALVEPAAVVEIVATAVIPAPAEPAVK
jgi:enamine deaminase RidA (YjgF/YER057c/UK114 family)